MTSDKIATLQGKLVALPDRPGVYLMKDARGQVIYIGKAALLRSRVRSYFQESRARDPKTEALVGQIRDLELIVTDTELEALILESNLVKKHRPRYNIILRDDKHYPFLKLTTNEEYPRLVVARRVTKDGAAYFGPYYPSTALRETLRVVRQLFPLRTCRIKLDGKLPRPCIQYNIHRCGGPCTGYQSKAEYNQVVRNVELFLEGKNDNLALDLTGQMERAAEEFQFERAARIRDQVQALHTVRERQKIISTDLEDQDLIGLHRDGNEAAIQIFFVRKGRLLGRESFTFERVVGWPAEEILSSFIRQFYSRNVSPPREILLSAEPAESRLLTEWLTQRRGGRVELSSPQRGKKREFVTMVEENAKLALANLLLSKKDRHQAVLQDLQQLLGLPEVPHRIEGFDISTIQGSEPVGSMVVWEGEGMKRGDYKRFKIKTVSGQDDFAMMEEVLRRRYSRALEEGHPLPDLVLIDGGRGQLNAGVRVLEELGLDFVPAIGLAKREEEIYLPDRLHPLSLDRTSPALHLLMRIRDEAHRFAVTYHTKLRAKRTIQSVLDQIPGVGPAIRTSLLRTLGSAKGVREASVAELAAVPRVTLKLAQKIYDFFHPPAPME